MNNSCRFGCVPSIRLIVPCQLLTHHLTTALMTTLSYSRTSWRLFSLRTLSISERTNCSVIHNINDSHWLPVLSLRGRATANITEWDTRSKWLQSVCLEGRYECPDRLARRQSLWQDNSGGVECPCDVVPWFIRTGRLSTFPQTLSVFSLNLLLKTSLIFVILKVFPSSMAVIERGQCSPFVIKHL